MTPDRGEQRPVVPEVLGVLAVRKRDRAPILTDEIIDRIRQVLGVEEPIEPVEKLYSTIWHIDLVSGISLDLSAHFTRLGRVSSADVLAYDEVRVLYTEGQIQRNVQMTGVSRVLLSTDEKGEQDLQFVQTTDKRLKKIIVRQGKVVLDDNANGNRGIPPALIRNFRFVVL